MKSHSLSIGKRFLKATFPILCFFIVSQASATHIKSAEITYERISASTFTYRFTVSAIRDSDGNVPIGLGVFDFGDGSIIDNPREKFDSRALDEGGNLIVRSFDIRSFGNYELVRFTIEHTYTAISQITVSYKEENRNEGILNIDNSVNTIFYVESLIAADPIFGINSSPELLVLPIDEGITKQLFTHNPGAFDKDGDSLSYSIVTPLQAKGTNLSGYVPPNDARFYDNFNAGNEAGNDSPSFHIDPVTGTLTWDAPGRTGEYTIAILIEEWRIIEGIRFKIGSVTRDMQISILSDGISRPLLNTPTDVCLIAGNTIDEIIEASSDSGEEIDIDIFSNTFDNDQIPEIGSPEFSDNTTSVDFNWQTNKDHISNIPRQFIIRASENDANGNTFSTTGNWKVTIKEQSPTGLLADTSLTATIDLNWDQYPGAAAGSIQIWRRENSITNVADSCFFSPSAIGYELIATADAAETFFRDDNNGNGLPAGTTQCYRISATSAESPEVFSYFSAESCDKLGGNRSVITAAVEGLTETSFSVYPNPSDGLVTLSSTSVIRQVEIVTLNGQSIYASELMVPKATLNLQSIESGIYIIRAYTNDGLTTKRFVRN